MSDSAPEELGFELPPPAKTSKITVLAVVGIVLVAVFAFGYMQYRKGKAGLETPASEQEGGGGGEGDTVKVEVMKAKVIASDQALELPGIVKPLAETKLYPRITGYVKKFNVDIGDKVTEGQVLAEIDTPELDAQLAQARAQATQARAAVKQIIAQRDYSKSSATRYQQLADQKLVAQAQVEQVQSQAANDEANLSAMEANVVAADANVRRLGDLSAYTKIVAPFAGKITARYVEKGASVVADQLATPLFVIAATDPVRVFVDVPQTVAPTVKAGTPATVTVREYGDRKFAATVARSAGALDPALHTMQTEVRVPNGDGALLPGMYVTAAITLPVPHKVLEIPATALYADANGTRLATVDKARKVHYVPITIERDTGATLWVSTGLTEDDRILKIAVPTLQEGEVVEVTQAPEPAKGSASK